MPPSGDTGSDLQKWWQVLGSNQRRLSRRFYSPSLLPEVHAADQRVRRLRLRPGPRPSAMRPCAPGLGHGRGRKSHGRGRWERLRRPSLSVSRLRPAVPGGLFGVVVLVTCSAVPSRTSARTGADPPCLAPVACPSWPRILWRLRLSWPGCGPAAQAAEAVPAAGRPAGAGTVHDYHDELVGVLASSLAKRAPGYTSLAFPDPRKLPYPQRRRDAPGRPDATQLARLPTGY